MDNVTSIIAALADTMCPLCINLTYEDAEKNTRVLFWPCDYHEQELLQS